MSSDTAGIRVEGLEMSFPSPSGTVVAIRDVSFTVAAGGILLYRRAERVREDDAPAHPGRVGDGHRR